MPEIQRKIHRQRYEPCVAWVTYHGSSPETKVRRSLSIPIRFATGRLNPVSHFPK